MSTKIDGRSKEARAAKAKKVTASKTTTKAKRAPKKMKPPFKVLLGRVNAAGTGYVFDKPAKEFKASDEAMAFAQGAVDKEDDSLREIIIVISPDVAPLKEGK